MHNWQPKPQNDRHSNRSPSTSREEMLTHDGCQLIAIGHLSDDLKINVYHDIKLQYDKFVCFYYSPLEFDTLSTTRPWHGRQDTW